MSGTIGFVRGLLALGGKMGELSIQIEHFIYIYTHTYVYYRLF